MFNFKLYLQLQNSFKKEEKCTKFMKHLKYKNNSLKNNKKLSKELKKTFVKEIYKSKFILLIFVSFYSKTMRSVKRLNRDLIKSNRSTKRNKNKSKSFNNK